MSESLFGGRDQTGAPLFQTTLVFVLFVEPFVVAGIVATGRRRAGRRRQHPSGGDPLLDGPVVLAVQVVELERRRVVQLGTGPPRRQTLQERIVNREIRVVLVQEPDGGSLYRYLKFIRFYLN